MIMQLGGSGVDAAEEMVVGAIEEDHHVFQMLALVGDAQGMDHRLLCSSPWRSHSPLIETESWRSSPLT